MNKIILVVVMALLFSVSHACDVCGSGVGNYNPFLFPHLAKSYLSLNYMHRYYRTHSETGISGKEYYNSFLLTTQFSIGRKIQLIAMLPYQVNELINDNESRNLSGVGDASVLLNYKLFNRMNKGKRQTLLVGAGIKLPTGKYTPAKTGDIDDQNFQLGTGSIDYILNASYNLSIKKWAFIAATSYKYNTQNKSDYRFGDLLTGGATAVYRIDIKSISISPYAQVISEIQMKDAASHVIQDHSGGHTLYTGAGIDLNTRKIAFGVNYQVAATQHMAEGQIIAHPRLAAHISFVLN